MAIYHLTSKPVSRSSGRSAVAAAAYRSGENLINERDGQAHDFRRREGVEHAEIVLPEGVDADWARDRSALWNAAENSEKRKDARVAREVEVALPHELNAEQRLALCRSLAGGLAERYGVAVDFAIHSPHGHTDARNHHAHLLMTTRAVTPDGLGEKTDLERENKWLQARGLPIAQTQIRDLRERWADLSNEHLARAGIDARIDHRSHSERGLEIEPTRHMGVTATEMDRRGEAVNRTRIDPERSERNAQRFIKEPEALLGLVTQEKSVFDRRDVARALHRYVDDAGRYQSALAAVMASPALVELERGRYSTREMVALEGEMAAGAGRLREDRRHHVRERDVAAALDRQNQAIRRETDGVSGLSTEQRVAVEHVTGPAGVAAVVGYAGAGKSTMLRAAREAWEASGYRVHGAALAGRAAEGLEESSGIESRTLASWQYGWQNGKQELGRGDVLVIDEAGMIGSRQLSGFVREAEERGAKLVLVGDHEQLQAIGAGAAFRSISEQVGSVDLTGIRRQREDWQREASVAFASHRTEAGLRAYHERDEIRFAEGREAVMGDLVRDYMADRDARPDGGRIALAHRRADVAELNAGIRTARQERGELAGEQVYRTNAGERAFAAGDRLLFLENNRDLGVKNGTLATVERAERGHLDVRLDGQDRLVSVPVKDYAAFDHGYATTIHKSQGATVDRSFVLASRTMDRHLTYVSMTRHRDAVTLYAGRDEFKGDAALSRRLSRSGAKETTLGYTAEFARHRGMDKVSASPFSRLRLGQEAPGRGGVFSGLRLGREAPEPLGRGGSSGHRAAAGPVQPGAGRSAEKEEVNRSLESFARAWSAVVSMERRELPVLEGQKKVLEETERKLNALRPGLADVLRSAARHDSRTAETLTELSGPSRVSALWNGVAREKTAQADPEIRAERFVNEWRQLSSQQEALEGWRHEEAREKVEDRMRSLLKGLEHDPKAEPHVARQLGMDRKELSRSVSERLERQSELSDRDRGLDIDF